MAEMLDEILLIALRLLQIGLTIYAIFIVWKWKPPIKGSADMLLPLLAVLLAMSVLNLLYVGRALAEHDIMWWAYTIYDLALPLTVIKIAGGAWTWPFRPPPQSNGA